MRADDGVTVLDESDWNEGDIVQVMEKWRHANPIAKYCASKTLAEKGKCLPTIVYI